METALSMHEWIVRIGLFIFAGIGLSGGALQFILGQPDTTPRLDNVHRFMAGVYFSTAVICLWAGITIRDQGMLVYLLCFGVFVAGCGRLLSMVMIWAQLQAR